MPFKPVPTTVDFPVQEREILQWWKEADAFNTLRRLRASSDKRFSFLDGPITANGPMGVHHAWGRTYKDVWQRYSAMKGCNQRWQNGFDCQGLWIEVNVEKDLGFKSKRDIEEYGLAPFVVLCKQKVLNYAAVQTEQSIRLGYWVNWDDPEKLRWLRDKLGEDSQQVIEYEAPDGMIEGTVEQVVGKLGWPSYGGSYFTFSDENNYQIWRFLKTCHEKGWIYKGTDVMPWCYRCGTGISQHEIVTEGYVELTHTSLTVRFPLRERAGEYLLVWTTMPWTLIPNVMVAVGPELTYLKVKQGNAVYYLSEHTTHMLKGAYEVIGKLKGSEMEGWTYVGPFDELPAEQEVGGHVAPELRNHVPRPPVSAAQAHRVILYKDVNESEGTGLVHMGTGGGPEDFRLGKEYGLPIVAPLDENGVFMEGFGEFSGMNAFDVTPKVIESLQQKGMLYRTDPYTHRYPQCWRCQTPLVFRLVDEWFIAMDGARQLLMDVTNQIRWIPDFGKDRELDWLRNMHDWMISKKRYWGLALPIWECSECGHFEVIGSVQELKVRAVEGWDAFEGHTPHRPYIDAVKIKCSHCGALVERIKDVGNPWLDAGIVSISTMGYTYDRAYWEKWFPADFITESFPGQFRNWFYSLLTMGAVMTARPPFKTVLGYATLLGGDGRAMHKSWGNAIEFNEAADNIGADVMRWMFVKQRYESDIWFGYNTAAETRRQFFIPLWNVYSFFVTYANLDGWTPGTPALAASLNLLDRWILARLHELIGEVTAALDDYDAPRVARAVEPFADDLSNWYVRRSRRRFWKSESDADKNAAYATLYEVLLTLAKLLAPLLPFLSETMYQNLARSVTTGAEAPESVHHCDWPTVDAAKIDTTLLADMAIGRQVVTLGHSTRASHNLKVRQPLAKTIVVVPDASRASIERMSDVIADELNVKSVELAANEAELVTYRLLPDNKKLGPKFGAKFPELRKALAEADTGALVAAIRSGAPTSVGSGENTFDLAPDEILVTPQPREGFAVASEAGAVVALDTALTPELAQEGLARDVVRRIQDLRKKADFDISDRIVTTVQAEGELKMAIETWIDYIKVETLSDELRFDAPPAGAVVDTDSLDRARLTIGVAKK
ncbi:MAG: isoleucine--tRNA ligase [Anaerolineae bacterium]